MVEYIIGEYLISKGSLSRTVFNEITEKMYSEKEKLGSIGIREKILTEKQVKKIHEMQRTVDKKFGELAVQYGGISSEELELIVGKQKEISKNVLELIKESGVISSDELMCELECFRNEYELTEAQFKELLDDDIDTIASIYIKTKNFYTNELYNKTLRFIMRFLGDRVRLGELREVDEYHGERAVVQKLRTEEANFVLGFAGNKDAMHKLNDALEIFGNAQNPDNRYAQLFDFMNCIDCLFECEIMRELKIIGLGSPVLYRKTEFIFSSSGFVLPISIGDIDVDIIVASGVNANFVKAIHNI